MADPTPPPPAPKKNHKPRSLLDSATLNRLDRDEQVVLAVQRQLSTDAEFAAKLSSHFLDANNSIPITKDAVDTLASQLAAARSTGAAAVSDTAELDDITKQEATDKANLLASIHNAQARAKEKYEESAPAKLQDYWVGRSLTSRAKLEQAAASIYQFLRTTDDGDKGITPQDTLPGFDQAAIDLLKARYAAYTHVQTDQTFAQGKASGDRTNLKEQCAQINRRRRKIQLAIDAEYPPGETNAAFRKEFRLPGDKAMS